MEKLLKELADIQSTLQARMDYAKTLALLRALKAGIVTLDNVTLIADGWSIAADAPPEPPKLADTLSEEVT
jgi:hypothetical protein